VDIDLAFVYSFCSCFAPRTHISENIISTRKIKRRLCINTIIYWIKLRIDCRYRQIDVFKCCYASIWGLHMCDYGGQSKSKRSKQKQDQYPQYIYFYHYLLENVKFETINKINPNITAKGINLIKILNPAEVIDSRARSIVGFIIGSRARK